MDYLVENNQVKKFKSDTVLTFELSEEAIGQLLDAEVFLENFLDLLGLYVCTPNDERIQVQRDSPNVMTVEIYAVNDDHRTLDFLQTILEFQQIYEKCCYFQNVIVK